MKYSRYSSYDSKQLQDIVSEIPRIHVPKKKVALCYWGIARSTDFTIESIERNIWKPLEDANIEYTTFVHTFSVNKPYTNSRASEWNIHLKNDIWKMLLPDHYIVENQEDIEILSTDKATIKTNFPVSFQIDGEYCGTETELDIKISSSKIKVAIP